MAQRDDRGAVRPRLRHADPDCLRAGRLPEAVVRVDQREAVALGQDGGRLPGRDLAVPHPVEVARHADHAVAVVAGEVGVDEVERDPAALVLGASFGPEDRGDEVPKALR